MMARYDSSSTEEPGQYPAPSWTGYGLPAQDEASGAPGSMPPSSTLDPGQTNEPGQYPDRDAFTGVGYSLGGMSGSGAPGSAGVPAGSQQGGPDTVTFSKPTFYKGEYYEQGLEEGYSHETVSAAVSGPGDWTQANKGSYAGPASRFLPALRGNMPLAGEGPYQPGNGRVLHGGYMNGSRDRDRNDD
jgi:hypothetical protein